MTETTTTENIVFTPDGGIDKKNIEKKEDKLCPQCYKEYLADTFTNKEKATLEEIYREIEHFRCLKTLKPTSIQDNTVYRLKREIDNAMREYRFMNDTDQIIFDKLSHISSLYHQYLTIKKDEERWHEATNKITSDILKMVLGVDYDRDFSLLS